MDWNAVREDFIDNILFYLLFFVWIIYILCMRKGNDGNDD